MRKTKEPFVIVFGHEKGGTGKSTLATHLAVGLMYYNKNYKVAFLDLDNRQLSSLSFFQNRKQHALNVPMPEFAEKIGGSKSDSKKHSYQEDFANLEHSIASLSFCDFIIIDTAGSYNNFIISSLFFCDLLITPVTESHFDINAIVELNKYEKNILNGPFYELVFEQRKARKLIGRQAFDWVVIINRASALYNENAEHCQQTLETLGKSLDFNIQFIIKDRNVYKELCHHGLTIFDLPFLCDNLGMIKMKAHAEMDKFVFTILDYLTEKSSTAIATP